MPATQSVPLMAAPRNLAQHVTAARAFQAVIWGMPAVNYELLFQAARSAGASTNRIVYWSHLPDWKNQTLTPNPDILYFLAFIDTAKAGPMVLEIPPADEGSVIGGSITGSIDDAWQGALEDVGPAGMDQGKGGKYLILPPGGHHGAIPDGHVALPCDTYRSYALLRSNIGGGSDAEIAKAAAYGRRVRLYPLAQAGDPPATTFVDAADQVFDGTIPYDTRFFEALDRFVQREPWLPRDKAMIDILKAIGIEKGKNFAPDATTQSLLDEAATLARGWLEERYLASYGDPYFKGGRWSFPISQSLAEGLTSDFSALAEYPVDARGVLYSFAFFSAKHPGGGQFYLFAIRDKDGEEFDGAKSYRLTIPANPPVTLYWSVTVYDRATHAFIRDQTRLSRASNSLGLEKNEDGSVDIFFGPQPPPGKAGNWAPTGGSGRFEVIFRFYGPQKPLFDKEWVLPDIENTGIAKAG